MSQEGKIMITMMFTAGPEDTAEGDKLFAGHAKWMEETHHKDGELELLRYNIAKGPEYTVALDPSSEPTGNTIYTLCEVYKNPEGLMDHWKQAQETWADFGAIMEWSAKVKLSVMHGSPIAYSLW